MPAKKQVQIYVGTRKGAFILSSDAARKHWEMSGPMFKGWNIMHTIQDPRDGRIHAAIRHDVYGPSTHYSDDAGEHWSQAGQAPAFPRAARYGRPTGTPDEALQGKTASPAPEKVLKVWNITPGRPGEAGVLYAGVEPAALFKSHDRGETWTLVEGLYDHPHRPQWNPGAGGLCLHTILLDPGLPERMYVAISAGGCYRTDDGGNAWAPYNKNVRADFYPDPFPEYGH